MWFKNIKAYRLTSPLSLHDDDVQSALTEVQFRPCGKQEAASMGFAPPFSHNMSNHNDSNASLFHRVEDRYWFCLKKQERLLPAAVVNAEVEERKAQIEVETGVALGKKAQQDLKQEIITRLMPQAFTKNTFTHGFISLRDDLVVVDASTDGKAEAFLAMLRKALQSLPVVPIARHSLQSELTHWLTAQPPTGISLLEEVELKSTDEVASIVRCKNQPLDSEEIETHLAAGKLVQKVAFEYQEAMTALIAEDGSIKRIKFSDQIKEEVADIPKDQVAARMDAEFALMSGQLSEFIKFIQQALNLEQE